MWITCVVSRLEEGAASVVIRHGAKGRGSRGLVITGRNKDRGCRSPGVFTSRNKDRRGRSLITSKDKGRVSGGKALNGVNEA